MEMYNAESKANSVYGTLVSRSTSTFFSQFPSFFFPSPSLSLFFLFKRKKIDFELKSRRVKITLLSKGRQFRRRNMTFEATSRRSSRMKMQESYFVRATETFITTVFRDVERRSCTIGRKFRGRTR